MRHSAALLIYASVFAFVGGCENDSPEDVSCSYVSNGTDEYCISGEFTESDCANRSGTVVSKCPAKAVASCELGDDGKTATIYFYSEATAKLLSIMCAP
jgi:hypothetical protein